MTDRLKDLLQALALVVAFAGGYWTHDSMPAPEPQVIVQKVTEDGKKETVYVDRIVTKVTKPDGTVIERQQDKQQTTKQEIVKQVEKPKATVFQLKTKYSLDVRYEPSLVSPPSFRDVGIEAGFRLGESNAWLTSGYSVKHNQLMVGIRYEF